MRQLETKQCVRCLKKKARTWCGYVLKDGEVVLAGWCGKCEDAFGFVGHYKKKMKTRKAIDNDHSS